MENKKLLEVKHLKQHFKSGRGKNKMVVKAVDDVSFDIYDGEVFGLVGESGCGKTTTGRSIIKLYDATDGEVYFDGKRIGGGPQIFFDRIAELKEEARVASLEFDPAKLAKEKIINEAKAALAAIDSSDKVKIAEVKKAKAEKLAALKAEVKSNPEKFAKNVEELAKVKAKFNEEIAEQKHQIHLLKTDNALKGDTLRTMKNIQMIFQDPISSLNPRMTVREIIAEGLIIDGEKSKKLIDEKVFNILKIVGLLPEHAFRYPHEFSGGQRQRIGIARALIVEPQLLIADEPISALDVSIQAQVINLLKNLQEELGLTILFIAHDLSVVKYFSDRIAVMYFGHIVELAGSDQLFAHPLHPYTKSLLSAIPLPDPHYEKTRQRFAYDPSSHGYGPGDMPEFVEIESGHFVLASPKEVEQYKKDILLEDNIVKS
jgi:oligopeptide transport system ATP-binding protein